MRCLLRQVLAAILSFALGFSALASNPVGNRKQITSTLAPVPAGLRNYDANDRFTAGDTYDDNGNTVSSGGIANVYDFENHLIQKAGVSIVYDGRGSGFVLTNPELKISNRVQKTVAGVTTKYLVDTQNPTGYAQVVYETLTGNTTQPFDSARTYVYGLELISKYRQFVANNQGQTQISYYVYDGHGSVRALTSTTGAVTDTYDYDAFGNLIHSTGTTPNNYLFAGEQFDPDLGLYFNRSRYLNVSTGRFWTADTFEGDDWEPASLHKYLYAGNNPVDRVDPSGNDFDLTSLSIGAGISGTIDAISAIRAHETLTGVAKSFLIGSIKGAAFFLAGGAAFKLLATAGEAAAASLPAVQAAGEFLANVVSKAGPLIEGLQLPRYFSLSTGAGEVFVKQNATKHLEELLLKEGTAGATKLAAALAVDEVKAVVEDVAAQGLDAVAGKLITTKVGSYTVEIVIEAQPDQVVKYAITHLLFMN